MHPVLIRLGSLDIYTYGVLVAAGFVGGLMVAAWRAKRAGIPPQHVSDLGIWLIVAGMGSAKILHLLLYWDSVAQAWHETGLRSLREGFVFYGGFIGASIATVIFARLRKVPLWKLADVLAPSVALGHALGRLGCFFNGCCAGRACSWPWAVPSPLGVMVHPTQLYESAGNLAIFAALTFFWPKKKYDGQVWWLYVFSYGTLRFGVEFFRGDYPHYYLGVFTNAHIIAAALMALSGAILWKKRRQQ
jgi:phosphatidylglycerol:prolipoprotein diacylglycerol transferase